MKAFFIEQSLVVAQFGTGPSYWLSLSLFLWHCHFGSGGGMKARSPGVNWPEQSEFGADPGPLFSRLTLKAGIYGRVQSAKHLLVTLD